MTMRNHEAYLAPHGYGFHAIVTFCGQKIRRGWLAIAGRRGGMPGQLGQIGQRISDLNARPYSLGIGRLIVTLERS